MFNRDMAEQLIHSHAIMFDPHKGWTLNTHKRYPDAPRSPFYIDFRAPLRSIPPFRRIAAQSMEALIRKSNAPFDCVSDAPQAVTPLVVMLSDMMDIPMISPRLNAKEYGLKNEIDGFYEAMDTVAIVDDVRTSGRTLQDIIDLYRRYGLTVSACFTVIDRSAEGNPYIGDVPYSAEFNWSELLGFYRDQRIVTPNLYERCIGYPTELEHYTRTHHPLVVV